MKKLLFVSAHVATVAGLCMASVFWLYALSEGVHAHGHTGHQVSLLAQAFGDFSSLRFSLPEYMAVTLGLLLIVQSWGSPRPLCSGEFLRLYPVGIALWYAGTWAVTWLLWQWDFQFVPAIELGGVALMSWCLLAVPTVVFCLGLYALVAYLVTRRAFYPHLYAAAPVLLVLATALALPASRLEGEWHYALPRWYPRLPWLCVAVAVLLAAYFFMRWLWARVVAREGAGHVAAFVIGGWSWALMSWAATCALLPHHHMCLTWAYVPLQLQVEGWAGVFFACLWCLIAGLYLSRRAAYFPQASEPAADRSRL